MAIDPICGMTVGEASALTAERDGILAEMGQKDSRLARDHHDNEQSSK